MLTGPRIVFRHSLMKAASTILICGAPACGFVAESSLAADSAVAGPSTVPVQVASPVISDVPIYLDGLGAVQAFNTVAVKSRVDGQLQSVNFIEGQYVKKGDLLAVIDPRPYQAALDQAVAKIQQDEADLANAKFLLGKDQKLSEQGITTQETLEAQESQVSQLVAQLAQDKAAKAAADISLSYTQITSPIDGRTGIRLIDAGNQIQTTDSGGIVVVTEMQPISVISTLREDDLPSVQQAQKQGPVEVEALSSDKSSKLATGHLSLIDNEIDQSSGTIRIKSEFQNADNALWPGQFVTLRLRDRTLSGALTVPSSALQRGTDGFYVYVVNPDSTVSVRQVSPGPIEDGKAAITTGLAASDKVVTQGQYRLQEGTKVSFTPIQTSTTSASKVN
ncbi:RND transporter [Rhizobium sp. Root708]|uniref:efflux RND transporter periplasmic adaptor subunit n=1 Tax=Rhizobium sp. Root708 TaxID=1736592 RepID=UPI0006F98916|nr:efflux RND transporter periplasmic adaptor subunit [Rhizobium sp. Root708]KRB51359.1 RND transporter [Rhizobium sp. Root708]